MCVRWGTVYDWERAPRLSPRPHARECLPVLLVGCASLAPALWVCLVLFGSGPGCVRLKMLVERKNATGTRLPAWVPCRRMFLVM